MEPDERALAYAKAQLGPGRLIPIAGDASARSFWRWRGGRRRAVLMVFPPSASAQLEATLRIHRLLSRSKLPVPRLLNPGPRGAVLAFQDLGNTTLQHWIRRFGAGAAGPWLERGRRLIHRLQAIRSGWIRGAVPDGRALAPERFGFELDYFRRHYVAGLLGRRVPGPLGGRLDRCFAALCDQLARQPRVLCHRDLMSRNLMVFHTRLWLLDFQDAQWGPYTYDLASLLYDSSTRTEAGNRAVMAGRFRRRWNREQGVKRRSQAEFEIDLHRAGLQRNLKELGTFAAQSRLWARPAYLKYVPRALRNLRWHLRRLPEGPELASLLHKIKVLGRPPAAL